MIESIPKTRIPAEFSTHGSVFSPVARSKLKKPKPAIDKKGQMNIVLMNIVIMKIISTKIGGVKEKDFGPLDR